VLVVALGLDKCCGEGARKSGVRDTRHGHVSPGLAASTRVMNKKLQRN
jgi:hypothetical protein